VFQVYELDAHSTLSGTELAVLAGGLIAGLIGNLQAGVTIALDHLLQAGGLAATIADAHAGAPGSPARARLQQRVMEALALNPPAALLPRQVIADVTLQQGGRAPLTLAKGTQVLLAIGAGTRERLTAAPVGASPRPAPAVDPLI